MPLAEPAFAATTGPRSSRGWALPYSRLNTMAFNRDHLRYFVAVADEGQITQAARRLFMAQPALSQAISQLETELGLKLLDRHARGVTLTDAGETFLEKARAAVAVKPRSGGLPNRSHAPSAESSRSGSSARLRR